MNLLIKLFKNFLKLIFIFYIHGDLIKKFIVRDIKARYQNSFLGIVWSIINPILILIIYTFVFSVVFKMRWGIHDENQINFALTLFVGLMIFNIFSEVINKSPFLIISNPNYVKKIIFPLEILPIITIGSAIFHGLISFFVWLFFYMIFYGLPDMSFLLYPFIIIPLLFFIFGLSLLISALTVYVRDMAQVIPTFTTILMFLSPIFYSLSVVPEKLQIFFYFNPLTVIVESSRNLLIHTEMPPFLNLLIYTIAALIFMLFSFMVFVKLKKGFSDVI